MKSADVLRRITYADRTQAVKASKAPVRVVEEQLRFNAECGEWLTLREVTLHTGCLQDAYKAFMERYCKRQGQGFSMTLDAGFNAPTFALCSGSDGKGNKSLLRMETVEPASFPEEKPQTQGENVNTFQAFLSKVKAHRADPFQKGCTGPCCNTEYSHEETLAEIAAAQQEKRAELAARVRSATEDGTNRQLAKRGLKVDAASGISRARIERFGSWNGQSEIKPASEAVEPVQQGSDEVPVVFKTSHGVQQGTYTVVFAGGAYKTLRVRKNENPDFFNGEGFSLAFLSGSDNESDYTSFGLLKDNGAIVIWKKYRGSETEETLREAMSVLMQDPGKAGEAYALSSGKCWHCSRKLTVPTSLHRGLGPVCSEKLGIA